MSLRTAINKSDANAVARLIKEGAPVEQRESGFTHLCAAVRRRAVECVAVLLKAGADPNKWFPHYAPLHYAVISGSLECIKMLLEGGARADLVVEDTTPMDLALRHNLKRAYPLLLRAGANFDPDCTLSEWAMPKSAYLRRIAQAGDFRAYERAHLAALTNMLSPKLSLPARPARLVVEFYLRAPGCYPYTEA